MEIRQIFKHEFLNTMVVEFETADMSALNVFPAGHYITKGECIVKEQKHEQVGNIFIENRSEQFLLFTDMDILEGAKQNRVVNISTLVRPGSKSNLEVSCVEQNRWDHLHGNFRNSDDSIEPDMREKKITSLVDDSDPDIRTSELQSEIWDSVSYKLNDAGVASPTSDYGDYIRYKKSAGASQDVPKPSPSQDCNGLAFYMDGKPRIVETFGNTALYQYYFPMLVHQYFSLAKPGNANHPSDNMSKQEIQKELDMTVFSGARAGVNGVGELRLLNTEKRKGFGLEYEGEGLHEVVMLVG